MSSTELPAASWRCSSASESACTDGASTAAPCPTGWLTSTSAGASGGNGGRGIDFAAGTWVKVV